MNQLPISITMDRPESNLQSKLNAWESNPVGKCGSCQFAQGFEAEKGHGADNYNLVHCNSLEKAAHIDWQHSFCTENRDLIKAQGWFNLCRIEYQGRFSCECWQPKAQ